MEQQRKQQHATPPATSAGKDKETKKTDAPHGPYAGRPLDGSQYLDVVEEQEYAEQRPTAEEQRPRFSYLKDKPASTTRK